MKDKPFDLDIPIPLLRLLSASLPVGHFAYSRGLEYAVRAGWVYDATSARNWIFGVLADVFTPLDGALFLRMMAALKHARYSDFLEADAFLSAARESREFLLEDLRMAEALTDLMTELGDPPAHKLQRQCRTFPGAFAQAANAIGVAAPPALAGLMWSLCDAQVAASIRLVPLGQTDGQRILREAPAEIQDCVTKAHEVADHEIGALGFFLAIGSALHETQGSRLFRS